MQKTKTEPKIEPEIKPERPRPDIDPSRRLDPERLCPEQKRRYVDI